MKKLLFILIIFLFIDIPETVLAEELRERVLIKFNGEINLSLLEQDSIEVHHIFESLSIVSATIPESTKKALLQQPTIERIERDSTLETSEQLIDWGYNSVFAHESRKYGWTGKGVKIGIIDTGIRTDHPDLSIEDGISFVKESPSYDDDQGHGTHVAGIIAALDNDIGMVGVAPEAELYAIKALNSIGEGYQSDVIAGIEWATNNKMDIINLSLTSDKSSYFLEAALNNAYENGILIIASSGNSTGTAPPETDVLYPAKYQNVIAVGSINSEQQKSLFSYYGPSLEFVAPGEGIYSTYEGSINGEQIDYIKLDGTSMAAPFVTGVAALYKQAYTDLNNIAIRQIMQNNAIDLGKIGKDPDYGYGLVQAPTDKRVFLDVPVGDWYTEEIEFLYKEGIVTGYEDNRFLPNIPVTRAEAITMIGRALKYDGIKRTTRYFDVIATHYGSGYIELASENQIVNGYPNGSFRPNSYIIRGDVSAMLQRSYHLPQASSEGFSDVSQDKYYYEPIMALSANRIAVGYTDKTFKPLNQVTRAEFSVFLARVLNESFKN